MSDENEPSGVDRTIEIEYRIDDDKESRVAAVNTNVMIR